MAARRMGEILGGKGKVGVDWLHAGFRGHHGARVRFRGRNEESSPESRSSPSSSLWPTAPKPWPPPRTS
jgi:hypothetical protein